MKKRGKPGVDYFLIILIIFAIAGGIAFIYFYEDYNPLTSIDIKVTSDEAIKIATDFADEKGFNLEGYKEVSIFSSDQLAPIYLQRSLGIKRSNELMEKKIYVWFWGVRFFKPLEKEELRFRINPSTGELMRFDHVIEETKEGSNLEQEAALEIAIDFLKNEKKLNLAEYEQIEASSEKLEKRTDHYFIWKKINSDIEWEHNGEIEKGNQRVRIDIQGDEIGQYAEYFFVPENFKRDIYGKLALGDFLSLISMVLSAILIVIAIIVLIVNFKKSKWKFFLAIAIISVILSVLIFFNSIPIYKAYYSTGSPYFIFLGRAFIYSALFGAAVVSLAIFSSGTAGEFLSRKHFSKSTEIIRSFINKKILTKKFALSTLRGYVLAFISLGIVTLFYIIGSKYFGVWYPLESPYSEILGTYLPFLFPITIGFIAAFSEELTFRLFAISFFKKYVKYTFLAVLIPSVIWAFAHSSYAVFPVWVRGIELTIVGVIYGYFFIKYDITTVLISHYSFNAIVVSVPLLLSSNTYLFMSGIIAILLAFVPALIGLFAKKKG